VTSHGARRGLFDPLDPMGERAVPRLAKDDVADVDVTRVDGRDRHALAVAHGRSHAVSTRAKTELEPSGEKAVGDGGESASIQRDDLKDSSVASVGGLKQIRGSDF